MTNASLAAAIAASLLSGAALAAQSASPDFGPQVLVFDPSQTTIQAQLDAIFAKQERAQFAPERYALLFKPGHYSLNIPVGFYEHVIGLGAHPDDVTITGSVNSLARWMRNNNATCNFWRAVENIAIVPTSDNQTDIWAVSQGTALRRVHIEGNLNLWDGGWSSGGFLADSLVDGQVNAGTQQQWLTRNSRLGHWAGHNWNMVFVGVEGAPKETWPAAAYTTIEQTPVLAEKPYLVLQADGSYAVRVPRYQARPTSGVSWNREADPSVPLEKFYLAHPERDTAGSINAAVASGKHLLLTPGVYHLEAPIELHRAGTIVLGIGYPTLVADKGTAAVVVDDIGGVRLSGVILDAGETESPTLLQVGPVGSHLDHRDNPTVLYDLFARSGGAQPGSCRSFVTINSADVIGDNFWLWRADHGKGAKWPINRTANGLVVNGRDVTVYGLFVEHTQQYQTLWNADGGRVYFYQSEMPYDPPSLEEWTHGGVGGYASYKVSPEVSTHEAWGLGIYSVFFSAPIVADSAIEAPRKPGIRFHDMVTVRFNGKPGSGIRHVINDVGDDIIAHKSARVTEGP